MEIIERFIRFPIASIDRSLTVVEALFHMSRKNVSSLLVTAFDEYVGIITKTDIENKVNAKGLDPKDTAVSSAMTRSVFSVDCFTTTEDAKMFMQQKGIGHLAITKKGYIVGVISFKDLSNSLKQACASNL